MDDAPALEQTGRRWRRAVRRSLTVGLVIVAILCVFTAADFRHHVRAFPTWFTVAFPSGLVVIAVLCAAGIRLIREAPLEFISDRTAWFIWMLLVLSFLCTSSVHQFYPFRPELLSLEPARLESLRQQPILVFNFSLTAIGFGGTALLALLYLAGRRKGAVGALLGLGLVLLVPNDSCPNPFNEWWIGRVGASPLMFVPNVLAICAGVAGLLGVRPGGAAAIITLVCLSTLLLGLGHMTGLIW